MDFGGGANLQGMMGMGMPGMMGMNPDLMGMGPDMMQSLGMGMMGGLSGMMGGGPMGDFMAGAGMAGPMGGGPMGGGGMGAGGPMGGRPNPPPPPMPPMGENIKPGNIFWKTRICTKWMEGRCQFSDAQCNYAHGEHQLRFVSPELVKQVEGQKALEQAQLREDSKGGGGSVDGPGPGDRHQPPPPGHPPPHQMQGGGGGGGGEDLRKTRLCHEFMRTGVCHKGANCRFAHGPEELRQPGGGMGSGPHPPFMQDGPGGMGMPPPPGGPGMFRPPPPSGMGMAGAGLPGMMGSGGPRPPPPAGPPPPGPGMPPPLDRGAPMGMMMMQRSPGERGDRDMPQHMQQQRQHPRDDERMEGEAGGGLQLKPPSDVPLLERVRAMCALLGVGEAAEKPDPSAVQAAMVMARNGSAFHETAYADSIDSFMRQQAAPAAY